MSASKTTSMAEVGKHNKKGDAWIVVDNHVLDVSKFAKMHPGGEQALLEYAGGDASEAFWAYHRMDVLSKYVPRLKVADIPGEKASEIPEPGSLSEVPFAEKAADMGMKSYYYKDSHRRFRDECRAFIEKEIKPLAPNWDLAGQMPTPALWKKMGKSSLLATRLAPGPHLKLFTKHHPLFGGVKPEEFDMFHEMIAHEELSRIGCPGVCDGLGAGYIIGLPAVIKFAPDLWRDRVTEECMLGEKQICLAITEPVAGSDVASIKTTAVLSDCGKFYIVNGLKKWITNGVTASYFVTAVRTGGAGLKGLSLLLIERSEGLQTELMKTSYSTCAGTAYVTLENVKVPVENLLGKENEGFKLIMHNFNHERWYICVNAQRTSRLVVEECMKWANQRQAFGKALISQPVIRSKLAKMVASVEACQAWLEQVTHQMDVMSYADQVKFLAGPLALLKYQVTRTAGLVADESAGIFGGRAISRTGMGQVVERINRSQKIAAVYGGSEEIMADLGIKQALKQYPAKSRL